MWNTKPCQLYDVLVTRQLKYKISRGDGDTVFLKIMRHKRRMNCIIPKRCCCCGVTCEASKKWRLAAPLPPFLSYLIYLLTVYKRKSCAYVIIKYLSFFDWTNITSFFFADKIGFSFIRDTENELCGNWQWLLWIDIMCHCTKKTTKFSWFVLLKDFIILLWLL